MRKEGIAGESEAERADERLEAHLLGRRKVNHARAGEREGEDFRAETGRNGGRGEDLTAKFTFGTTDQRG